MSEALRATGLLCEFVCIFIVIVCSRVVYKAECTACVTTRESFDPHLRVTFWKTVSKAAACYVYTENFMTIASYGYCGKLWESVPEVAPLA